ncbi:protein of unknown function [Mesotoga infera]|uniref:Uncharacterized protein n=1 Tax=Mesotoga infera TaxID=1236046 RepID=A0A7Z7LF41_9BACT|nr:protein of unknown function [Mesotoga infera]
MRRLLKPPVHKLFYYNNSKWVSNQPKRDINIADDYAQLDVIRVSNQPKRDINMVVVPSVYTNWILVSNQPKRDINPHFMTMFSVPFRVSNQPKRDINALPTTLLL